MQRIIEEVKDTNVVIVAILVTIATALCVTVWCLFIHKKAMADVKTGLLSAIMFSDDQNDARIDLVNSTIPIRKITHLDARADALIRRHAQLVGSEQSNKVVIFDWDGEKAYRPEDVVMLRANHRYYVIGLYDVETKVPAMLLQNRQALLIEAEADSTLEVLLSSLESKQPNNDVMALTGESIPFLETEFTLRAPTMDIIIEYNPILIESDDGVRSAPRAIAKYIQSAQYEEQDFYAFLSAEAGKHLLVYSFNVFAINK